MQNQFQRPTQPAQRPVNSDLVALLEQKLLEAKQGRLVGLGVVSVTMGQGGAVGIAAESRGEYGALILAGTVELKEQVRAATFPPAVPQQGQAFPVTRPLSS